MTSEEPKCFLSSKLRKHFGSSEVIGFSEVVSSSEAVGSIGSSEVVIFSRELTTSKGQTTFKEPLIQRSSLRPWCNVNWFKGLIQRSESSLCNIVKWFKRDDFDSILKGQNEGRPKFAFLVSILMVGGKLSRHHILTLELHRHPLYLSHTFTFLVSVASGELYLASVFNGYCEQRPKRRFPRGNEQKNLIRRRLDTGRGSASRDDSF